jgi:hypothetical protein
MTEPDKKTKVKLSGEKTKVKFHHQIRLSDMVFEAETGASTEKFTVDPKTLPVPKTEAEAEGMSRTWYNKAKSEQDKERSTAYLAVSKKYTQLALQLGKKKTLGDKNESLDEASMTKAEFHKYQDDLEKDVDAAVDALEADPANKALQMKLKALLTKVDDCRWVTIKKESLNESIETEFNDIVDAARADVDVEPFVGKMGAAQGTINGKKVFVKFERAAGQIRMHNAGMRMTVRINDKKVAKGSFLSAIKEGYNDGPEFLNRMKKMNYVVDDEGKSCDKDDMKESFVIATNVFCKKPDGSRAVIMVAKNLTKSQAMDMVMQYDGLKFDYVSYKYTGEVDKKQSDGYWIPASGGAERPFKSRSGITMHYMWNPKTGKHAYLNVDTDIIMTDDEAEIAMQKY